MRENRSYGAVGEPVGNCRLYPDPGAAAGLDRPAGAWAGSRVQKPGRQDNVSVPRSGHHSRLGTPDRRLVRSTGPRVWSPKFRVCPHIPSTMALSVTLLKVES